MPGVQNCPLQLLHLTNPSPSKIIDSYWFNFLSHRPYHLCSWIPFLFYFLKLPAFPALPWCLHNCPLTCIIPLPYLTRLTPTPPSCLNQMSAPWFTHNLISLWSLKSHNTSLLLCKVCVIMCLPILPSKMSAIVWVLPTIIYHPEYLWVMVRELARLDHTQLPSHLLFTSFPTSLAPEC